VVTALRPRLLVIGAVGLFVICLVLCAPVNDRPGDGEIR